jgi:L-glyceraldehyde 3-phosphate reductase
MPDAKTGSSQFHPTPKLWRDFRSSESRVPKAHSPEIARKRGQSLAQMALAWVSRLGVRDGVIASVLFGASSVEQWRRSESAVLNGRTQ